jgi:hypothetical protein
MKEDGTRYYEYLFIYTDNILALSMDPLGQHSTDARLFFVCSCSKDRNVSANRIDSGLDI